MRPQPPSLPDAQTLLDFAPCGLVVTKEDGTILAVNDTFEKWLGHSQLELCGRRFQDLLTIGGKIFHQTHWAPLMQIQGSVAEVKLELMHRDRHKVTMLLNGVRREHPGGAFYQLALFVTADRDRFERELIGARKLAEELLQEKTVAQSALLQAQNELKVAYESARRRAEFAEQMVAIVSHDLKNPLTAIKMAADILARLERTAKETLLLGHISQSSERAQRMISDLLDFAIARAGRGIAIAPSAINIHEVVSKSVAELRVTFLKAKLVHQTFGPDAVNLDADRIHQVIGNLVGNSVAYGDLDHPITITSGQEDGRVFITVHNYGPVIPTSLVGGLFEPMTRGTEINGDLRSVGLGLFIVREIARAHGGSVSVESAPITGTTFRISFPMPAATIDCGPA